MRLPSEILYEIVSHLFVDYLDEYIDKQESPSEDDQVPAIASLLCTSRQLRAVVQTVVCDTLGISVNDAERLCEAPQKYIEDFRRVHQQILAAANLPCPTTATLEDIDMGRKHTKPLALAYKALNRAELRLTSCQPIVYKIRQLDWDLTEVDFDPVDSPQFDHVYEELDRYVARLGKTFNILFVCCERISTDTLRSKIIARAMRITTETRDCQYLMMRWLNCRDRLREYFSHSGACELLLEAMVKEAISILNLLISRNWAEGAATSANVQLRIIEAILFTTMRVLYQIQDDEPPYHLCEQLSQAQIHAEHLWLPRFTSLEM